MQNEIMIIVITYKLYTDCDTTLAIQPRMFQQGFQKLYGILLIFCKTVGVKVLYNAALMTLNEMSLDRK